MSNPTIKEAFNTGKQFKIPENISFHKYPEVIRDFKKHILYLKISLRNLEDALEQRRSFLYKTNFKSLGSNEKEREAAFNLMSLADLEYSELKEETYNLEWIIKSEEIELEKVVEDFSVARLKRRESVVQAELFGGIPITDS